MLKRIAFCFVVLSVPSAAFANGPTYTLPVNFTGSIDDPNALVTVNNITATNSGGQFTASDVVLQFGRNDVDVIATDEASNQSQLSITVYLDLPENEKTYALTETITGTVSEAGSTVTVNGDPAVVNGTSFTYDLALTYGTNTIVVVAADPIGNNANMSINVFVDAPAAAGAPVINTITPSTPTIAPATFPLAVSIDADDPNGDPLQYRAMLGSTVVVDWQSNPTFNWTPTTNQLGPDTLTLEASDGTNSTPSSVQVFVVRPPVEPGT